MSAATAAASPDAKSVARAAKAETFMRPKCGTCKTVFVSVKSKNRHVRTNPTHTEWVWTCFVCAPNSVPPKSENEHFASPAHQRGMEAVTASTAAAAPASLKQASCEICLLSKEVFVSMAQWDRHLASPEHVTRKRGVGDAAASRATKSSIGASRASNASIGYAVMKAAVNSGGATKPILQLKPQSAATISVSAATVAVVPSLNAKRKAHKNADVSLVPILSSPFVRPKCSACSALFVSNKAIATHFVRFPAHKKTGVESQCVLCDAPATASHLSGRPHAACIESGTLRISCPPCGFERTYFATPTEFDAHLSSSGHADRSERKIKANAVAAKHIRKSGGAQTAAAPAIALTRYCAICRISTTNFERHAEGDSHQLLASAAAKAEAATAAVVPVATAPAVKSTASARVAPECDWLFLRPFCSSCGAVFVSTKSVNFHLDLFDGHTFGGWNCFMCDYVCETVPKRDAHVRSIRHRSQTTSLPANATIPPANRRSCDICDTFVFPSLIAWDEHLLSESHFQRLAERAAAVDAPRITDSAKAHTKLVATASVAASTDEKTAAARAPASSIGLPTFSKKQLLEQHRMTAKAALAQRAAAATAAAADADPDPLPFNSRPMCDTCVVAFPTDDELQSHLRDEPTHESGLYCLGCNESVGGAEHAIGKRHRTALSRTAQRAAESGVAVAAAVSCFRCSMAVPAIEFDEHLRSAPHRELVLHGTKAMRDMKSGAVPVPEPVPQPVQVGSVPAIPIAQAPAPAAAIPGSAEPVPVPVVDPIPKAPDDMKSAQAQAPTDPVPSAPSPTEFELAFSRPYCWTCSTAFATSNNATDHLLLYPLHPTGGRICLMCGSGCATAAMYNAHLTTLKHTRRVVTFTKHRRSLAACGACGFERKEFKSVESYDAHLRSSAHRLQLERIALAADDPALSMAARPRASGATDADAAAFALHAKVKSSSKSGADALSTRDYAMSRPSCATCKAVFASTSALVGHLHTYRTHEAGARFCLVCGGAAGEKKKYVFASFHVPSVVHLRNVSASPPVVRAWCGLCFGRKHVFGSVAEFDVHLESAEHFERIAASSAHQPIVNENQLQELTRLATADASRGLFRPICGTCGVPFATAAELVAHVRVHTTHVDGGVFCLRSSTVCKTSKNYDELLDYAVKTASPNSIDAVCPICTVEPFATAGAFDAHLRNEEHALRLEAVAAAKDRIPYWSGYRPRVRLAGDEKATASDSDAQPLPEPALMVSVLKTPAVLGYFRPTCHTCGSVFASIQSLAAHLVSTGHLRDGLPVCLLCPSLQPARGPAQRWDEHVTSPAHLDAVTKFERSAKGSVTSAYWRMTCGLCMSHDGTPFESLSIAEYDRHLGSDEHRANVASGKRVKPAVESTESKTRSTVEVEPVRDSKDGGAVDSKSAVQVSDSKDELQTVATAAAVYDADAFRPRCGSCQAVFSSFASLAKHLAAAEPLHIPSDRMLCLPCGDLVIRAASELQKHLASPEHLAAAARRISVSCNICSETRFTTAAAFDEHLNSSAHNDALAILTAAVTGAINPNAAAVELAVPATADDDSGAATLVSYARQRVASAVAAAVALPGPESKSALQPPDVAAGSERTCATCPSRFASNAEAANHFATNSTHREGGLWCTVCRTTTQLMAGEPFDSHIASWNHQTAIRDLNEPATVPSSIPAPVSFDAGLQAIDATHEPSNAAVAEPASALAPSAYDAVAAWIAFARPICLTCNDLPFASVAAARAHESVCSQHVASAFCMTCGSRASSMQNFRSHVSTLKHIQAPADQLKVWCPACDGNEHPFASIEEFTLHLTSSGHLHRVHELSGIPPPTQADTKSIVPHETESAMPESSSAVPSPVAAVPTPQVAAVAVGTERSCLACPSRFTSNVDAERHFSDGTHREGGLWCTVCGVATRLMPGEPFDSHIASWNHQIAIRDLQESAALLPALVTSLAPATPVAAPGAIAAPHTAEISDLPNSLRVGLELVVDEVKSVAAVAVSESVPASVPVSTPLPAQPLNSELNSADDKTAVRDSKNDFAAVDSVSDRLLNRQMNRTNDKTLCLPSCSTCRGIFVSPSALSKHLKSPKFQTHVEGSAFCLVCGVFPGPNLLTKHLAERSHQLAAAASGPPNNESRRINGLCTLCDSNRAYQTLPEFVEHLKSESHMARMHATSSTTTAVAPIARETRSAIANNFPISVARPACVTCSFFTFSSVATAREHETNFPTHSFGLFCTACGVRAASAELFAVHAITAAHRETVQRGKTRLWCAACRGDDYFFVSMHDYDLHLTGLAHAHRGRELSGPSERAITLTVSKKSSISGVEAAGALPSVFRMRCQTCRSNVISADHFRFFPNHSPGRALCLPCGKLISDEQAQSHVNSELHINAMAAVNAGAPIKAFCGLCSPGAAPTQLFRSISEYDAHLNSEEHSTRVNAAAASMVAPAADAKQLHTQPPAQSAAVPAPIVPISIPELGAGSERSCLTCPSRFTSNVDADRHFADGTHREGGLWCTVCGVATRIMAGEPFDSHIASSIHQTAIRDLNEHTSDRAIVTSSLAPTVTSALLCSIGAGVTQSPALPVVPPINSASYSAHSRPTCFTCKFYTFDSIASAQKHASQFPLHQLSAFCLICGVRPISMNHFDQHVRSSQHVKRRARYQLRIWCPVCGTEDSTFSSIRQFDAHLQSAGHIKRGEALCGHGRVSTPAVAIATEPPATSWERTCLMCRVAFTTSMEMVHHLPACVNETAAVFTASMSFARPMCCTCDLPFETPANALNHQAANPSHVPGMFCMRCGVRATNMLNFRLHVVTSEHLSNLSAGRLFNIWCSNCPAGEASKFASVQEFDLHLRAGQHNVVASDIKTVIPIPTSLTVATAAAATQLAQSKGDVKTAPAVAAAKLFADLFPGATSVDEPIYDANSFTIPDATAVLVPAQIAAVAATPAAPASNDRVLERPNAIEPAASPPLGSRSSPSDAPSSQGEVAATAAGAVASAADTGSVSAAAAAAVAVAAATTPAPAIDEIQLQIDAILAAGLATMPVPKPERAPEVVTLSHAPLNVNVNTYCDVCYSDLLSHDALIDHCLTSAYHRERLQRRNDADAKLRAQQTAPPSQLDAKAQSKLSAYCMLCAVQCSDVTNYLNHCENSASHLRLAANAAPRGSDDAKTNPKANLRPVGYCELCHVDCVGAANYLNHCATSPKHNQLAAAAVAAASATKANATAASAQSHDCKPCRRSFDSVTALNQHCATKSHLSTVKPATKLNAKANSKKYYCSPCNQQFPNKIAYTQHCAQHCVPCKSTFRSAAALAQHVRDKHGSGGTGKHNN